MNGAVGAVPRTSRTTIFGILVLVAAGATLATHAMTTGIGVQDILTVSNALAGMGLIKAADEQ